VCYSRPTVYAYVPNFVSVGLFCRPLLAKNPQFCRFWTSAFSGVANWQRCEKVKQGCTDAFMAKSGAKSLTFKSVTDRQTNRQTDKQTNKQTKNSTFSPPRRRVKFEPHQNWHGDRAHRALSCTSTTSGGLTHSFAAMGR